MDEETKKLLQETVQLSRENNHILKKLHKGYQFSRITSFIRWVIVIGIALGSFYFLQPYVERIMDAYTAVSGGVNGIKNFYNPPTTPSQ